MAIKDVLMIGNPVLRELSDDVSDFDVEPVEIIRDLSDTLADLQVRKNIGRALAAPQIGYLKNVIHFRLPDRIFNMINPEIVWKSDETFKCWDSCFSLDAAFFVEVERYKSIRVDFLDENGEKHSEEFHDDLSELMQHEIDHLHGVLCTDRLDDVKRIMMRSEWEKQYASQVE